MNKDKKTYKYEVHMHTSEASACGKTGGADYIDEFIRLGYDGMIITDHFYHGNTAISRDLSWSDYVDGFCRGYEAAKEEGDRRGFKVFFGWEENFSGDEFLVYGPDKAWLKAHPAIKDADEAEYLKMIHAAGGCVVQAHPFRERGYLSSVRLHPLQCDAMEACNFGNPAWQDALAYNYCRKLGKLMTSGTDLHDVKNLEASVSGMVFDHPLENIGDYVRAILTGKGFTPLIPEERKALDPENTSQLPIWLYDENNECRKVALDELL